MAASVGNLTAKTLRLATMVVAVLSIQACARTSSVAHPALLSSEAARIADIRHIDVDGGPASETGQQVAFVTCIDLQCLSAPATDERID